MGLQQLLEHYGLIVVLLGAALEGDLTLVLAGVVAHLGAFGLGEAVGAGAVGAWLGDCGWYALGRWRGERFRASRLYRRVGPQVERLARRFGAWQLLTTRFVYGTKSASMLFWGLHGLRFRRFALLDAIGCLVGAAAFVGLGFVFSNGAEALLGRIRRVEFLFLAGAVLTVLVLAVIKYVLRRRHLVPGPGEPE